MDAAKLNKAKLLRMTLYYHIIIHAGISIFYCNCNLLKARVQVNALEYNVISDLHGLSNTIVDW